MNFGYAIALVASICALGSAAVSAKPVEEKNLVSGKFTFDPEKGYIYLYSKIRTSGMFLKIPSEEDIKAYEEEWLEELAKAQSKYPKKLKRWEKRVETAKKTRKKLPKKPVEPTRENFSIDPIDLRNSTSFGPQFVFGKTKDENGKTFSYMEEVEPGTYIYYGPVWANPNGGYFGTCNCMGSVQFEVKAGQVTNLGNFLYAAPNWDPEKTVPHK